MPTVRCSGCMLVNILPGKGPMMDIPGAGQRFSTKSPLPKQVQDQLVAFVKPVEQDD